MTKLEMENAPVAANQCPERVDIERAVWDDMGHGPQIVDWFFVCMDVAVRIELSEMVWDTTTTPPTRQMLYDITLSKPLPLEPDDRFVGEDGALYRLLEMEQRDKSPVAKVVREEIW